MKITKLESTKPKILYCLLQLCYDDGDLLRLSKLCFCIYIDLIADHIKEAICINLFI